jgi:hypothetical protein
MTAAVAHRGNPLLRGITAGEIVENGGADDGAAQVFDLHQDPAGME